MERREKKPSVCLVGWFDGKRNDINGIDEDRLYYILIAENDKLREQKYKDMIRGCEPESLLRIIKTTYLRKKERLEQGKKNTMMDEKYLNLAEKHLFSELCVVLGKNKDEVQKLLEAAADKQRI